MGEDGVGEGWATHVANIERDAIRILSDGIFQLRILGHASDAPASVGIDSLMFNARISDAMTDNKAAKRVHQMIIPSFLIGVDKLINNNVTVA